MDNKKIAKLVAIVFIVTILSPPCFSVSAQASKPYGGVLRIGYIRDPISFNGVLNFWSTTAYFNINLFDPLITYDKDYNLIGVLADKWEQSPDGKTWTFHLHPGVKWQDGVPFSSADVKYHFMNILLNNTSFMRGFLDASVLLGVDTPDANTAIFHFKNPARADNIFANAHADCVILPKHIYEGQDFKNNPANLKPIGTGPFKLVEYVKDDHVTMDANPDYFKGRPYLDRLIWYIIPKQQTAELAFQNGQLDEIHETVGLPFADISSWQKTSDITVDTFQYYTTWRIAFNFRPKAVAKFPWVADVRVRQAMWHAIDRESIIKTVLYGITGVSDTAISNTVAPYYNPNTVKYPYDPAKAEQLLDAAGFKRGPDGWKFHATLVSYQTGQPFAEVIKQYLAKVGIDIDLKLVENTTFFSLYESSPEGFGDDVPMGIQTMGTGPDPSSIYNWIYSRPIGDQNSGFYSNPDVDKLLDEAKNTVDQNVIKADYLKIQDLMAKDAGFIFLWNNWKTEVYRNTFGGFKESERPLGWYNSFRLAYWTLGKPLATTTAVSTSATTTAQPPAGAFDMTTGAIVMLIVVVAGAAFYMSRRKKK